MPCFVVSKYCPLECSRHPSQKSEDRSPHRQNCVPSPFFPIYPRLQPSGLPQTTAYFFHHQHHLFVRPYENHKPHPPLDRCLPWLCEDQSSFPRHQAHLLLMAVVYLLLLLLPVPPLPDIDFVLHSRWATTASDFPPKAMPSHGCSEVHR